MKLRLTDTKRIRKVQARVWRCSEDSTMKKDPRHRRSRACPGCSLEEGRDLVCGQTRGWPSSEGGGADGAAVAPGRRVRARTRGCPEPGQLRGRQPELGGKAGPATQALLLEGPNTKELFAQPPWDTAHLLTQVTSNSKNHNSSNSSGPWRTGRSLDEWQS